MKKLLASLLATASMTSTALASDFLALAKTIPLEVPSDSLTFEWDFVASAYYSPLSNQSYYLTGDYDSEKVLNGNGTNGASGAEVFLGMIAAPSVLPFGTQIYIPGVGLGEVQDRGGAIQNSRIDIWMGKGESALYRALEWGKRAKHCTVYLPGAQIPDAILAKNFSDSFIFSDESSSDSVALTSTLHLGSSSSEVKTLQESLQALDYLDDFDATTYFGSLTETAVIQFQLDHGIIESTDDDAAGYFGPQTSAALTIALKALDPNSEEETDSSLLTNESSESDTVLTSDSSEILGTGGPVLDFDQTLTLGDSGPEVKELQEILKNLGYFKGETTEYFGMKTATAVFAFQIEQGIVTSSETPGAGFLGPLTKRTLQDTPLLTSETSEEVALGDAISSSN